MPPLPLEDAVPAAHFELMRLLAEHPEYTQRQLAVAMGVSLGKTHYLLKALLSKGWVKVQNFKRNSNKIACLYRLTPHGIALRVQLTRTFLRRKEQQYLLLSTEIAMLKSELESPVTES